MGAEAVAAAGEGRQPAARPSRPPALRGGIYAPGNKGRIVPGGVLTGMSVRGRGGRWGLSEGNFGGGSGRGGGRGRDRLNFGVGSHKCAMRRIESAVRAAKPSSPLPSLSPFLLPSVRPALPVPISERERALMVVRRELFMTSAAAVAVAAARLCLLSLDQGRIIKGSPTLLPH